MADIPHPKLEYSPMAGHMVGLLLRKAPLLVGVQENGGEELAALLMRPAQASASPTRRF